MAPAMRTIHSCGRFFLQQRSEFTRTVTEKRISTRREVATFTYQGETPTGRDRRRRVRQRKREEGMHACDVTHTRSSLRAHAPTGADGTRSAVLVAPRARRPRTRPTHLKVDEEEKKIPVENSKTDAPRPASRVRAVLPRSVASAAPRRPPQ